MKAEMMDVVARPVAIDPRFLASALAAASAGGKSAEEMISTERVGDVAVIRATGCVGRALYGFAASALADAAEAAARDAVAVVLAINSPGGTVDDVGESAARIAALSVPVVAHTGGLLCSAAYWLASGADAITGSTSSEVGSIGVYCPMVDVRGLYDALGVKVELAKTGDLKGAGFPGTEWTEAQKAHMQQMVEDIFEDFKGAVLGNRPEVPEEAMTGGAYMAKRAAGLGLLDAVGNLDDAVGLAERLGRAKQTTEK